MDRDSAISKIISRVERSEEKFPPFNTQYEGFAILMSKVDELWDVIRLRDSPKRNSALLEASIQVGAVALRFLLSLPESDSEVLPQEPESAVRKFRNGLLNIGYGLMSSNSYCVTIDPKGDSILKVLFNARCLLSNIEPSFSAYVKEISPSKYEITFRTVGTQSKCNTESAMLLLEEGFTIQNKDNHLRVVVSVNQISQVREMISSCLNPVIAIPEDDGIAIFEANVVSKLYTSYLPYTPKIYGTS